MVWNIDRNKPTALDTASITGANSFSTGTKIFGPFNVSISGTFVATVTAQRSFDDGASWVDVESFTAPSEKRGSEGERDIKYRIGVKAGAYTSGTVSVRVSQ